MVFTSSDFIYLFKNCTMHIVQYLSKHRSRTDFRRLCFQQLSNRHVNGIAREDGDELRAHSHMILTEHGKTDDRSHSTSVQSAALLRDVRHKSASHNAVSSLQYSIQLILDFRLNSTYSSLASYASRFFHCASQQSPFIHL